MLNYKTFTSSFKMCCFQTVSALMFHVVTLHILVILVLYEIVLFLKQQNFKFLLKI